jgi:hypothetical protein
VLLYSIVVCHGARLLEQRMWTILRSCRRSTPTVRVQPVFTYQLLHGHGTDT